MKNEMHSGYIAIVGKPNVGKSTLLNRILGKKLSITSRKPQTTRQRVVGIKTQDQSQVIYLDTPGLHQGQNKALNRYMNRVAQATLTEVDIIVLMVKALSWNDVDQWILDQCVKTGKPIVMVVNQCDQVKDRGLLLPFLEKLSSYSHFTAMVPISAKTGDQVDELEALLLSHLPQGPLLYPPEQFTDRSDRFVISEFVREKLMRQLGKEIPYSIAVTIDALAEEDDLLSVSAIIWVERDSQKVIVIGKKGAKLKAVGTAAREDLERYFEKKVYLQLWVKVKSGWSESQQAMSRLGFNDG